MIATKPKTRDRILASARELFFSKGLDETSIAEICKHSGVSNGKRRASIQSRAKATGTSASRLSMPVVSDPVSVLIFPAQ